MTVRGEVQKQDATKAAAISPQAAIKHAIDPYRPVIAKLLNGTGVEMETFVAQVANACRSTPDLLKCDPATVLGAALKAAQLALAPNDARNLCWILPYGRNAQFQLGYGGVMELARRADPGLRFDGRAVYPNDDFDLDYGTNILVHRPAVVKGVGRGGDAYAWYVRATFPDGTTQFHVLDREGVDYHRSFSKQPNGTMWAKSFDAAALKSVVLDMKRWLPASAQLTGALASDEKVFTPETVDVDPADVIDIEPEPDEGPELEVVPNDGDAA